MRRILVMLLPFLSFVLFGAHLLFHGFGLAAAAACVVAGGAVFVRNRAVLVLCSVLLVLAGFEWARTAWVLAAVRIEEGREWGRAAAIVGGCAVFTWGCALMAYRASRK